MQYCIDNHEFDCVLTFDRSLLITVILPHAVLIVYPHRVHSGKPEVDSVDIPVHSANIMAYNGPVNSIRMWTGSDPFCSKSRHAMCCPLLTKTFNKYIEEINCMLLKSSQIVNLI